MSTSLPLVKKVSLTFYSPNTEAALKNEVKSTVEASYSTVLTLANYILYHFPFLSPPHFAPLELKDNLTDDFYPQQHLTYNKLFEPWCDYLSLLFEKDQVSQKDQTCHLYDYVTDEFITLLNQNVFNIVARSNQKNSIEAVKVAGLKTVSVQQKEKKPKKKIALINFATSQLRQDKVQPKMHLAGLFTGIFFNQGDSWKVYNVLKRHYPTQQEYGQIDTVILSGSSLSVNDEAPEIQDFAKTLKEATEKNPQLKILGICFGHQTLAKMFGGKIVGKKLLTGVQTIAFREKIAHQLPYFRRSQLADHVFDLSEYHKDFVVEIPENFQIFAKSSTCKIQSLISKNMKFLSFQFHPEYSAEYIKGFQMRNFHYQIYDLQSSYSKKERGSIAHDSSLWQMRRVIRNFLDWQVQDLQLQL